MAFDGGTGTALDPYLISTAAQLNEVRNNLAAHYRQTADIDLSGFVNWVPIGDESNKFFGSYNGQGFEVSGLTITGVSSINVGLFGYVASAEQIVCENVILTDVAINVTEGSNTGTLVGYLEKGNIINCNSGGVITLVKNAYAVGGLIGHVLNDGYTDSPEYLEGTPQIIEGCMSSVDIHCDFTNAVSYDFAEACGGLVGYAEGYDIPVNIINSFATGNVVQTVGVADDRKYGLSSCGGFVGTIFGDSAFPSKIELCYSTGNVSTGWNNGGFVGDLGSYVSIQNCYSTGSVMAPVGFEAYDRYNDCGGFSGSYSDSRRLFINCYTVGNVSGISWDSDSGSTFGAFAPFNDYVGGCINCYYNSDTSERTDDTVPPKTTTEMKTQATFTDWDFETIWTLNDNQNEGYPIFAYQITLVAYPNAAHYVKQNGHWIEVTEPKTITIANITDFSSAANALIQSAITTALGTGQ